MKEMENRIKRRVMRQLQRDISKEIQQMLDERDIIINKLCQENRELKEIVTQHLGSVFQDSSPHHFNLSPGEVIL
ncbi:unnamed protein product [Phytomonas sp. Hart1]|nr:unnamed protein product [Phytomonas sp. Hart1]|eukprot:CCW71625.1 unnamed protein product [Phytomonas sp. isolate Hart1]